MLTVVQGSSGLLGGTIARRLRNARTASNGFALVDGRRLFDELESGKLAIVKSIFERADGAAIDWICASGLTDPRAKPELLLAANADGPELLMRALELCRARVAVNTSRIRLVTFGTILENRAEIAEANPYVRSKRKLMCIWRETGLNGPLDWHHVQLHTIFGGPKIHPFMFIGQMEMALRDKRKLKMSQGTQLREYHHVEDIAQSILTYLENREAGPQLIDLSSGAPISLRSLAEGVFGNFGAGHLLEIGAIEAQPGEIYQNRYDKSPHLTAWRDPVKGVTEWFVSRNIVSEVG